MKMNVFHVFVLVLVMWAVHSHGRAYETESITYNNTQLPSKENMHTGLVIHRNLNHFDYFYLALLWPESYCISDRHHCLQLIPDRFTLHGLWPQQNGVPRIGCGKFQNTAPLDMRKLHRNGGLVNYLSSFWPNLLEGRSDESFWAHEYDTHGVCFFQSQEDYFTSIVHLMNKILAVTMPEHYGIHPGTRYRVEFLRHKIFLVTGYYPKLQCIQGTSLLYQIHFCAHKSGALFNCVADMFMPLSNCQYWWVELPPLHRPRHGL